MTKFEEWARKGDYSSTDIVAKLKLRGVTVTRQAVDLWLAGNRTPRPAAARAIVEMTDGAVSYENLIQLERNVA